MATDSRTRPPQDSFLETLRTETVAGTENLGGWLSHIAEKGGADHLFRFEVWLRGLRAFFRIEHLPLAEAERANLIERSFVGEFEVCRRALQISERALNEVAAHGQPDLVEFEAFIESQLQKESVLDYHISRILEQPTPLDSLARMLEVLGDIRVLAEGLRPEARTFQAFLSLGRSYNRSLKECRYVDMLLQQRFKVQYDQIESAVLTGMVRGIGDEPIRQSVSVALLYCYRALRCLRLVADDLRQDRPLRHHLVIFALLHEDMGTLTDFLKSKFLKGRDAGHSLAGAAELVVYSLKLESQRALERELVGLTELSDASAIYSRIENSHGLLRNCIQNAVVTLMQAFDRSLEGRAIFPGMVQRAEEARRLHRELWALRRYAKEVLDNREELDLDNIMRHINEFKSSSLDSLMYQDWGEFEQLTEAIVTASDRLELRALLRQFVSFLEALVAEVSKRSVLKSDGSPLSATDEVAEPA